MLKRWWDDLAFAWAESTGRAPSARRMALALGGALLLVAALCLALLRSAGTLPSSATVEAASLNRNFGPGWRCTRIPGAQEVCIRDTPRAP